MADIVSKEVRSRMMSNIRAKNTAPEILVRKHLHKSGFRFRLQKRLGNTRPDLVLPKWNTCIFVHGCYWHRHPNCGRATTPKTRTEFWESKFKQNVERDIRNIEELRRMGWFIGIVWECTAKEDKLDEYKISDLIKNEVYWGNYDGKICKKTPRICVLNIAGGGSTPIT